MTTVARPARVLSDEEVRSFWEDGYVLVKGAVSKQEAAHYRRVILDLIPRDLTIPEPWHSHMGRIKPYHPGHDDAFDLPELLPLYANERVYSAAVQLLESERLRAFDGSVGITVRNDAASETPLSQTLHIDASVPRDVDDFLFTLEELQVGGCYYFTDVEPDGGGIHVVPGGHRLLEEEARRSPGSGRHLHNDWKRITHMKSVEVTGEAGDFALLHHLMPHGASHNRRPTARVAQFLRFVRVDHPHGVGSAPPRRYNDAQLAAMSPLCRKLVGLDPW